ncbi:aquaporin AQPAe.a-like [Vanessa tameamea]|uniref:Aquaporin AQPAe.a-like n=1 Tax=Vanessa tameamea TaxID=334116 RepID=A0A8B8HZM7_VANTA|nr:aquaporin AQPAe.a-like [Vanessa tameamea]
MSIFAKEDILKDYDLIARQIFAEFLGTFLYLSISLLAETNLGKSVVGTSLANGLLVASVIQIIGHISGGHINPAVTIGVLTCGHITAIKAILYIIAQIFGSMLGSAVAYSITDVNLRNGLGATVPYFNMRADQVFGLEFIMTFILVAVVLSVMDSRSAIGLGSGPLAIGLSVTACQSSAVMYSGSLNPVRSFGPAVVMNIWTYHWVYWVGPIFGGIAAGLIYRFIFTTRERNIID